MARTEIGTSNLLGGRYRLAERLASGGMGDVWRAHDDQTDRAVAVKLLRGDLADHPAVLERFRREASMSAAVNHPNVAAIYDIVDGDDPAIVMELIEGESLARRLARGPLPLDAALWTADAVLGALEAAHSAGIVHRDITPGNVLLAANGMVKVADFGIARRVHEAARLTDAGRVVGTAHYLAPEQLHDVPPTAASDQYAAAIVLYESLTGARPFDGSTPAAAALARLRVPPTPLTNHRSDIPRPVAAVVMRALEPEPSARFRSVAEMRDALRDARRDALSRATAPDGDATVSDLPVPDGVTATLASPIALAGEEGRAPRSNREPHPGRSYRLALVALLALLVLAGLALLVLAARVNSSPRVVEVPDFTGRTLEEARAAIGAAGLAVGETIVDAAEPEGTVLAQDVSPGVRVERSTAIGLSVSSGVPPCCTVPSVVGLALSDAQEAIVAAGLVVGTVKGIESDLPVNSVIRQDLVAGGSVEPGTVVDLQVSVNPDNDRRGKGRGNDD